MSDIFVSEKDKLVEEKTKTSTDIESLNLAQHHTHSPFASFCYEPTDIRFLNQDPKEKIILFIRRHPITNVGWIIISILFFLAPVVLKSFPIFSSFGPKYESIFILIWYLIAIAYTYEKLLDWFFSVFIVTDERVVDIDFVNLIYREISSANLDKIQDITVQAGGAVMALFGYGNVFIQTAAEVENIEFDKVPNPDKISRIIRNMVLIEEGEDTGGKTK